MQKLKAETHSPRAQLQPELLQDTNGSRSHSIAAQPAPAAPPIPAAALEQPGSMRQPAEAAEATGFEPVQSSRRRRRARGGQHAAALTPGKLLKSDL